MNRKQPKRAGILATLVVLCSAAFAADQPKRAPSDLFKLQIPELAASRQLVLVITENWQSVAAQLLSFERAAPGLDWEKVFGPSPAVIGRNGLAWGIGLHGASSRHERLKLEGDGRAPAGVFALVQAFGYAAPEEARVQKIPYKHLTPTVEGIDDPRSRYYNRVIDAHDVERKDWLSSEQMRRKDELYRWGVIVAHNAEAYPGLGSCIFLHGWSGSHEGTAGCTALPLEHVETIVRWLDLAKQPLIVQLPLQEYHRLKTSWALPDL